jgi:hypothetical protein
MAINCVALNVRFVAPILQDPADLWAIGLLTTDWPPELTSRSNPSDSLLEVVLDKIWVKHWEYKSWITFKLLSLKMWKSYQ